MGPDEIARIIPHAGKMCLLDRVLFWDAERLRCAARSHLDPDNPLRLGSRLGAACGVEYASQAMAVHGAVVGAVDGRPTSGYLASVRELNCHADRLDASGEDLIVEVQRIFTDEARAMYEFHLHAGEKLLVSGRAAVVLDAAGFAV
jgi:predicted hotdog family 3-hydroxylacyl-ACP dehydratase